MPAATDPTGEPADPFWNCPFCPYRIRFDYPGGSQLAILAHQHAHKFPQEVPLSEEAKAWKRGSEHDKGP